MFVNINGHNDSNVDGYNDDNSAVWLARVNMQVSGCTDIAMSMISIPSAVLV